MGLSCYNQINQPGTGLMVLYYSRLALISLEWALCHFLFLLDWAFKFEMVQESANQSQSFKIQIAEQPVKFQNCDQPICFYKLSTFWRQHHKVVIDQFQVGLKHPRHLWLHEASFVLLVFERYASSTSREWHCKKHKCPRFASTRISPGNFKYIWQWAWPILCFESPQCSRLPLQQCWHHSGYLPDQVKLSHGHAYCLEYLTALTIWSTLVAYLNICSCISYRQRPNRS